MITEGQLKACAIDLEDWGGIIPLSLDALRAVLEKDGGFVSILRGWHHNATGNSGLGDTQDREELFDVIARHFTGRCWPRYGDNDLVRKTFNLTLTENATAAGWKVLEGGQ